LWYRFFEYSYSMRIIWLWAALLLVTSSYAGGDLFQKIKALWAVNEGAVYKLELAPTDSYRRRAKESSFKARRASYLLEIAFDREGQAVTVSLLDPSKKKPFMSTAIEAFQWIATDKMQLVGRVGNLEYRLQLNPKAKQIWGRLFDHTGTVPGSPRAPDFEGVLPLLMPEEPGTAGCDIPLIFPDTPSGPERLN
jgi:hypothetical protein